MATRLPIGGLRFGARRSRRRTAPRRTPGAPRASRARLREPRSEEHTSELQSRLHLVCRLLLKKKKNDVTWTVSMLIPRPYLQIPTSTHRIFSTSYSSITPLVMTRRHSGAHTMLRAILEVLCTD